MSAWAAPESVVIDLLVQYGLSNLRAQAAAASILDSLYEADRDMLEAGAFELRANTHLRVAESRRVAERVWVAMLRSACQASD